jgi:hypothetical protein
MQGLKKLRWIDQLCGLLKPNAARESTPELMIEGVELTLLEISDPGAADIGTSPSLTSDASAGFRFPHDQVTLFAVELRLTDIDHE